ncbi:hypothetical protein [Bradyrhizobium arachidis]|nr:hypothetical protein [Bradyrhizobium arachidis]SFV16020.1 hypothetical protein SAMN05192541_124117 [Bradyrhizobium arachidis]
MFSASLKTVVGSAVLFLAGVSGGFLFAHVSQEPIEWYGSAEYWQRRALSYFVELRKDRARVAQYDELVRANKCEALQ